MNTQWCDEYTHLIIKAKALQKDCSKFNEKLQSTLFELGSKRNHSKVTQSLSSSSSSSSYQYNKGKKYDCNQEKEELRQKILILHKHCTRIRNALMIVLNGNKTGHGDRLEKVKTQCKRSIELYERDYEHLRVLCNDEIESLDLQREEICQFLHNEFQYL